MTQALLHDAPAALRAQVPEILLTALAMALRRSVPAGALVVDVEGHGREEVFPDVDLSRTVGWFTTIHPVALDPGPGGDPAVALARVKEQLRAVPERGFGYGVLRFLDARSEELLRDLPAAAARLQLQDASTRELPARSAWRPRAPARRAARARRASILSGWAPGWPTTGCGSTGRTTRRRSALRPSRPWPPTSSRRCGGCSPSPWSLGRWRPPPPTSPC